MGGKNGPSDCPAANRVKCECGEEWEPEDPNIAGACPNCHGRNVSITRCERCPLDDLDQVRGHSVAGRLLERVLELDFVTSAFEVPWDEITAEEVRGLQILREERDKYREEVRQRDAERVRQN